MSPSTSPVIVGLGKPSSIKSVDLSNKTQHQETFKKLSSCLIGRRLIKMNLTSEMTATAMAQQSAFNPWSLPESFTIYNFAPEDIRGFLHPHWHSQKSPHPMLYYFFGLYYLVMGMYLATVIMLFYYNLKKSFEMRICRIHCYQR